LCSQQQQQQRAAASVTSAAESNDVGNDVALRGSNGTSDIQLLVERMHAAAFLDNYLQWLRDAHGNDVTLQLMSSGLESWERCCAIDATDNSKLALIRHASRLLATLVQDKGGTLSTLSTDDSLQIFKEWHRSMKTTSKEALQRLQKVRGTFPFLQALHLYIVAIVIGLLGHNVRTTVCLVLCMLVCVDA
jgi:hypothetical protein